MTSAVSSSHFSIIVIDDSVFARSSVRLVFEKFFLERDHKHSMTFAADGREGWDLCQKHDYHLYVVDYEMPGMNGVELYRKILSRHPHANIVLYSSSKLEEIESDEGPIEKGVKYINKDIVELRKHLMSALTGDKV